MQRQRRHVVKGVRYLAGPGFTIENRTGYNTYDLARFTARALRATRTVGYRGHLRVVILPSPIRSRGCADVGARLCPPGELCAATNGRHIVIALAAPARADLRRLGRLFEHEMSHVRGFQHQDMDEKLLYSLGPTPEWAKGAVIRYLGRAPRQLVLLRSRPLRKAA